MTRKNLIKLFKSVNSLAFPARNESFFNATPLIPVHKKHSNGKSIHLKCDFLQPSGSFKSRGIGHMVHSLNRQKKVTSLVCSSGGNAGLAVACAGCWTFSSFPNNCNSITLNLPLLFFSLGMKLGVPVKVFVPSTTKQMMIDKLEALGAVVTVAGSNWNAADIVARNEASGLESLGGIYVPPFDHPLIWEGNSSLVHELLSAGMGDVDAIVLAVGGGGLLCGVQEGVEQLGWSQKTSIIAVETQGAASFAAAQKMGYPVKLDKIDTIATSLGALAVTAQTLKVGSLLSVVLYTQH